METLQVTIEGALRDAAQAHHTLIADMKRKSASVEDIDRENLNWQPFYAAFIVKRLGPVLTHIQCSIPEHKHVPEVTVRGKWDAASRASMGGPGQIAEFATVEAQKAKAAARIFASALTCHERGEC